MNASVPANWIAAAPTSVPLPRAVRSCSKAAVVKKSEPTKYVTATTRSERSEAPGNEATAKKAEPIMKRTPIRRASPLAAPAASTAADPALN